jgi:hypothetical protein
MAAVISDDKREIFSSLLTEIIAFGYSVISVKYFNPATLPDSRNIPHPLDNSADRERHHHLA